MVDTVFDRDYSARPPGERNGYVFHQADNLATESALSRALGLWFGYPAEFRQLMSRLRAGWLLVGPARSRLPGHLRVHPPPVS